MKGALPITVTGRMCYDVIADHRVNMAWAEGQKVIDENLHF